MLDSGEHFHDTDILGESEERVAVDENDESFPRRIEMNGNRDIIRMCGYPTLGKYGATKTCLTGNCSSTYGKNGSEWGHQCFLADNGLTGVDEDETFPVEPDPEPCLVNETREQEGVPYETPKQMKERIEKFNAQFCEAEQKEKELERQLCEEENEQEPKRKGKS